MKNFKTLFAVFAMSLFSLTAFAATVADLEAIDYDYVFIADDVTDNGTVALTAAELYASNHILAAGYQGNTVNTGKGSSTFSGTNHLNCLRIKGTQNMLAFRVSGSCTVTFYMQATSYRGLLISKTASDDSSAEGYQKQPANTAEWNISLPSAGVYYLMSYSDDPGNANADLFFAGFEITFPDDPAAVTFGVTRPVASATSTSSDEQASGYAVAEDELVDPSVAGISLAMNYPSANVLTNKGRTMYWFDGSETKTCYTDYGVKNYRNQIGTDVFNELNEGIYFSFDMVVADGYKLSLQRLISDVLKGRENTHYVVKIFNNGSLLRTFDEVEATATTSNMKRSIGVAKDASLQNLTGTVTVTLYFWNTAGAQYVAVKDLQVKAIVSHIADGTQTFGLTRTVDADVTTSSDGQASGYAVSDDSLVDPSVAGITVAKNFGSQNVLSNKGRKLYWYNGTAKQECYADQGTPNYRNYIYDAAEYINASDERCYYGFDMTVALGKQISLKMLTSDVLSDALDASYQVKIYHNGEVVKTLDAVGPNAGGNTDMKRIINLSEDAELQGLTGTVTVKLFWWSATDGKYLDVKDLNVAALIESVPGEGVQGLVFESFEASAHPSFTEGEVTAVWSNSANNVAPASQNRGIRVQAGYNYQMQLNVPDDSYISEVVFVWNSKGNKNAGVNDDYYIDFTVTDSNDEPVSTLQAPAKENETVWSCGDLRESQLTFTQGAGDFYCHSIRVTYLKKPVALNYVRTFAHTNLNTLCYPYQIDSYEGATFYTLLYKEVVGSDVTCVYLQEHVGALAAGTPYFYMPNDGASELVCHYSGERENTPKNVNGLQGSYEDNAAVPVDAFVTYNGELRKAGVNVTLGEYRAYVNMDDVATEAGPNYVPGRRMLSIRNADAPQSPTGVEQVQGDQVQSTKVLRDGQLYIMYNGTIYNVQGQMVK